MTMEMPSHDRRDIFRTVILRPGQFEHSSSLRLIEKAFRGNVPDIPDGNHGNFPARRQKGRQDALRPCCIQDGRPIFHEIGRSQNCQALSDRAEPALGIMKRANRPGLCDQMCTKGR